MIAIVGLGNPGRQYERSRHNAGFILLDYLCSKFGSEWSTSKNFEYFNIFDNDYPEKMSFIKPQTFMNLSGEIFPNLRNENISKLIVVVDNIDLALGKIRFKLGGSSAGHNGLKSIIANYPEHENFYRMYIGAGGDREHIDAADLVLSKIKEDDFEIFNGSCHKAGDILQTFLKDYDFDKARMSCGS